MNDTMYSVEILGTGDALTALTAALDQFPHLPLPGSSYLVAGEEARAALEAHAGSGDVAISLTPASPGEAEEILAPARVIAAFLSHVGRDVDLAFHWDEEARLWCMSSSKAGNYSETGDQEAASEEEAVRAALEMLISSQEDTDARAGRSSGRKEKTMTTQMTRYIPANQAGRVARALNADGFRATAAECTEYLITVARRVGGSAYEDRVVRLILIELDGFYIDGEGYPVYEA